MSAQQSNLSGNQWMYDMVVGVTQNSVNQTMAKFLKKFEGATIEHYEVVNPKFSSKNPNEPRTSPSDAAAIRAIVKKDIFSVEMDSEEGDAIARGNQFSLAIRGKLGIPDYAGKVLDIVQFDQGYGTKVSFRMCYKELEIVYVDYSQVGASFYKFVQNKDNFFSFTFLVDLNLREENDGFETLTKAQKDLLNNLSPDTMFSVNQLYINLTAPKLQSTPQIKGIDKTSPVGQLLIGIIQERYWDKMRQSSANGVILGSAVLSQKPNPNLGNPSLIPTNLNFMVMPYMDTAGKQMKENQGYATLNYIIASESRKLNPPSQLGWNWVQTGNQAHGVMAIRKENIFKFLKSALDDASKNLFYEPSVKIDTKGTDALVTVDFNKRQNAATFQINDKGLSLNYSKSVFDEGGTFYWKKRIEASSYVDLELKATNNKIQLNVRAYYQTSFRDGSVVPTSTPIPKIVTLFQSYNTYTFEVTVNATGKLYVTLPKPLMGSRAALGVSFDTDYIASLFGPEKFAAVINNMSNSMSELENELQNIAQRLENLFNNSNAWIFPGGNTFAFKEVSFSDNLDLVTHITYVNPT